MNKKLIFLIFNFLNIFFIQSNDNVFINGVEVPQKIAFFSDLCRMAFDFGFYESLEGEIKLSDPEVLDQDVLLPDKIIRLIFKEFLVGVSIKLDQDLQSYLRRLDELKSASEDKIREKENLLQVFQRNLQEEREKPAFYINTQSNISNLNKNINNLEKEISEEREKIADMKLMEYDELREEVLEKNQLEYARILASLNLKVINIPNKLISYKNFYPLIRLFRLMIIADYLHIQELIRACKINLRKQLYDLVAFLGQMDIHSKEQGIIEFKKILKVYDHLIEEHKLFSDFLIYFKSFSELYEFNGPLSYSPDGRYLALGTHDNKIKIWDIEKREFIKELNIAYVSSISYSSDGNYLAIASDNQIQILDLLNNKIYKDWRVKGKIVFISYLPRNKYLLSVSDMGLIKVWDISKEESEQSFYIDSMIFRCSPDGKYLASISPKSVIKIWNIRNGKVEKILNSNEEIYSIAYSPDGKLLALASLRAIRIWNWKNGELVKTLSLPMLNRPNNSIDFSPDGKYLAAGCRDGGIRIWDFQKKRYLTSFFQDRKGIDLVRYSPNGLKLAFNLGDELKLFDLTDDSVSNVSMNHSFPVASVSLASDGSILATGSRDTTIKLWDMKSGRLIDTLKGHSDPINSIDFSPDNKFLASGARDNTAKIWDITLRKCIFTLKGHTDYVSSVCFSPDGKYLATGSYDNTIRIWEVATGKIVKVLTEDAYIFSISYTPDGRRLAGGYSDGKVRLWDVETGVCIKTLFNSLMDITSISISPSGKYLAAPLSSRFIAIVDISTGEIVKVLLIDDEYIGINSIAYSPDGLYLSIGLSSGFVKVLDLDKEIFVQRLYSNSASIESIAYSRDGRYLAAGSSDCKAKTWINIKFWPNN